jgi:hypothetical protein
VEVPVFHIGRNPCGWKYSQLLTASAHITTNVQHMLEHIYNFVDGIETKTNNLPSDPASQSATGKPTGSERLFINEDKTVVVVPAPAAGFERTATITVENVYTFVSFDFEQAGSTEGVYSFTARPTLTTFVVNVPAGKNLTVESFDNGDVIAQHVTVTAIWWESATG